MYQDRAALAATFKTKGNTAYAGKKFDVAANLYTLAIDVAPKPEPVYYSNRAACKCVCDNQPPLMFYAGYVNMTPPKLELVVVDCDEALKLDPNYVKALNRRAMALEGLHRYIEALRGRSSTSAAATPLTPR
jgi:import receptor subunit TOM70